MFYLIGIWNLAFWHMTSLLRAPMHTNATIYSSLAAPQRAVPPQTLLLPSLTTMLRISTRLVPRLSSASSSSFSARLIHTSPNRPKGARFGLWGVGVGAFALGTVGITFYADSNVPPSSTTLSSLARSYLVYSLCSIPPLVNYSPTILSTCGSIPGLREVSEAVVRRTFFAQVRCISLGTTLFDIVCSLLEATRSRTRSR
jgi:hypothetical protein